MQLADETKMEMEYVFRNRVTYDYSLQLEIKYTWGKFQHMKNKKMQNRKPSRTWKSG